MLPFYQSLSSSKKYDFTFLFYNRRNVPLPSAASNKDYDLKKFEKIYKEKELKINFQFISNTYSDTYGIKSFYFNPKIFFMKKNYDLVIVSDNLKFPDIFFRIYCKINSIPLVIWSETTHGSFYSLGFFHRLLKKVIINNSKNFINQSQESYLFNRKINQKRGNYFLVPYHANTLTFKKLKSRSYNVLKKRLGLKGTVICSVGKLEHRKGYDLLLRSIKRFNLNKTVSVLIIGEGNARLLLESMANSYKINLSLPGLIKNDSLHKFFSISDIFVFPTNHDNWGFALSESMIFGLPVIASSGCCAAHHLIEHGKSGFIFKKGNVEQLSRFLKKLLNSKKLRSNFRVNGFKSIKRLSVIKVRSAFLDSLDSVLSKKNR